MNKPRKPWLAIVLTLFTIGLGHLYSGRARNGIYLFIGWLLAVTLIFSCFVLFPPYGIVFGFVITISYLVYCLADSFKAAQAHQVLYKMKKYNKWYVYLICWACASLVIQPALQSLLKNNICQTYKIPSAAMSSTLQPGDHIVCDKAIYKKSTPERGDIVIFPSPVDPSLDYAKRIIGLGGERIEIKDKKVFINNSPLNEPYTINDSTKIFPGPISPRDNFGPFEIPADSVFLMGDNRDNSFDSRFWGAVKISTMKGKVLYAYWSWDSENSRVRWQRIGKHLE